ncbi:CBS domain-containing protein [Azospirillum sp. INR13]|uniref:CBS domain-containing protein n=1 Tax=Azospirillum sp. INR13 TaxID=2596919 RepID=UPI002105BD5E|nr:CBS domain-containing protein [Azospirillum sp. INR13]
MKAIDLMTPRVITIGADATIADAAKKMLENNISGMPVVDAAGKVVGIISEGDLLRRVELGTERHRSWWLGLVSGGTLPAEDFVKSHARKVTDVMTAHVTTVDESASPEEVVRLMETRRIKRVPVVRQGNLIGIISRGEPAARTGQRFAGDRGGGSRRPGAEGACHRGHEGTVLGFAVARRHRRPQRHRSSLGLHQQ